MPRQNRVNPFSQIIATPARGTLMGNRGRLHNENGQIIRPYEGKRWIICQLQYKGRRRQIMAPGRYTELFFLDEATALAAGHRPCAECSRPRFKEFVDAWIQANPELTTGTKLSAGQLDTILHQERVVKKQKITYRDRLRNLPRGTFITLDDKIDAYLVLEDDLLLWRPGGYEDRIARPNDQLVEVLTPRSVVRTLVCGYKPNVHPSAL